jgi:hypothetical protein
MYYRFVVHKDKISLLYIVENGTNLQNEEKINGNREFRPRPAVTRLSAGVFILPPGETAAASLPQSGPAKARFTLYYGLNDG